ncbi:MAG: hypothetical protein KAY32_12890 [Candidatus Eisenbacteria sp.]|nr:hypothetical protein [Candidatus Eisenbacteria bacterium]
MRVSCPAAAPPDLFDCFTDISASHLVREMAPPRRVEEIADISGLDEESAVRIC